MVALLALALASFTPASTARFHSAELLSCLYALVHPTSVVRCFPTANPGNCSAWVSLAPAVSVYEASARVKFKLITKNKMFGEVKFSYAEVMKLRDGKYAFGFFATIDNTQLALAVTNAISKEDGSPFTVEPLALPEEVADAVGSGASDEESDDDEGEEEEEGEEEDDGEEEEEEGEEEEEEEEEQEQEESATVRRDAATSRAFSRRTPGWARRMVPDDDDSDDDDDGDARMAERSPHPVPERPAKTSSMSMAPPKKRAMAAAAAAAANAEENAKRQRWAPRFDENALCNVAVAVVATLRRRGTIRSDVLLPVAYAALQRQPPAVSIGAQDALHDTLRILVRTGYVVRRREQRASNPPNGMLPSYALSSYCHEQLRSGFAGPHMLSSPTGSASSHAFSPRGNRAALHSQRAYHGGNNLPTLAPASRDTACSPSEPGTPAAAMEVETDLKELRRMTSLQSTDGDGAGEAEEPSLQRKASETSAASNGKSTKYRISRKRTT
jgi:chemotaxis protein histidine kinase CheA